MRRYAVESQITQIFCFVFFKLSSNFFCIFLPCVYEHRAALSARN